jgi:predicted Zn-dependent peptidase
MVKKTVLANGIRIITQHVPHAHSVSLGFWIAGGSRQEQPDCNGISHFIEHLLFKGTARRSAFEIAREIDSVGGFLNAFTGREFVCYYVKVLKDFLPKAADLLVDIFRHSSFPVDEIENERKVILQEIRMLEDNPDDFLHDLFHRNLWYGHPLGMPIIGEEEVVAALDRDQIVAYRDAHYLGGDVIVTAAGNMDHDALVGLLAASLGQVPPGSRQSGPAAPDYIRRNCSVDRDLEQVLLCLGTRAPSQSDPRRFDALVLNTLLGGSMSSRLFQEVREKEGLAYSIYSYLASHSDTGALVISSGTTAERFPAVMEIVSRELQRLKQEKVAEEDLVAAREQLKGNILLSLESNDNIMSKLAKNEIYLGGYQPVEQVIAGFARVTGESLLELSRELFDERNFTLQLLGKMSHIDVDSASLSL